jgi:hypothetical protein
METILATLKRQLRAAGPKQWPAISEQISLDNPGGPSVSTHTMRKLAYGDRDNPTLSVVQPLLDYFNTRQRSTRSKG